MAKELKDLEVGDKVIRHSAASIEGHDTIQEVSRVTKTLIICGKSRYKKSNGDILGMSGYLIPSISPATPEDVTRIEAQKIRDNLLYKLSQTNFKGFETSTLQTIYDVLKRAEQKKKEVEGG